MKTRYSNQPEFNRGYSHTEGYRTDEKRVSRGQWYYPVFNFTLIDLLQRLFMGIKRLFVAIKYQIYKKTQQTDMGQAAPPAAAKWRIPWFKIGILALVVFMFMQKDFQFSINMRAPQGGQDNSNTSNAENNAGRQEMNIAQAISFKDNRPSKGKGRSGAAIQLNDLEVNAYIQRFRKVAIMEMKKFGVPASLKMAWGILESEAGQKPKVSVDNNHFGRLMEGQPYTTAWENWRAHSVKLQSDYAGLFEYGASYKDWIKALDKARVFKDQDFGKKMLNIIERYQLDELDQESMQ